MSPEAHNQNTQTGSENFKEGLHPTDGVREFKQGELSQVAEPLIADRMPIDPSTIHPETLEVAVNKIPLADSQESSVKEQRSKKGLYALAGGALSAALAAGTIFGLSMGDKAEPQANSGVSASPVPGTENSPAPVDTVEPSPVSVDELHMLQPGGTAESVQGNFRSEISQIINERVEAGVPVSTGEDLKYLVDMDAENFDRFNRFLQDMASQVESQRHLRAEKGLDPNVTIGIYSTIVSAESNGDNGYVIIADDEYDAINSQGVPEGVILGNLDRHRYTYDQGMVTLPNGTQKETFVVTGFEDIDKSFS